MAMKGSGKLSTISKAARLFGLSRSTLLYYDRVGLLSPSVRTRAGYRLYTEEDTRRLERICTLRRTTLSLEDIRAIISSEDAPAAAFLRKRLSEIESEIDELKVKQELISRMIRGISSKEGSPPRVDKKMWVEMLRAAGMNDEAMKLWHEEFECRAPEAHHAFLLSLGISEKEVRLIRGWSKRKQARRKSGDAGSG